LQGAPQDELPQNLLEKLQRMDMTEYLPVLGRNLNALQSQLPPT